MAAKRPARLHQRFCASLPPEVWITIFSYHTDLAHLWTTCRRVSSTLRACAEYAFGAYFLAEVHISFQLEKYNLGGKSRRPEVPVVFDRVGKRAEQGVVWFKDKRDKSEVGDVRGRDAQERYDKVVKRWEENVKSWKPEMPYYTISIGGLVNDTALPGLSIDVAEREVRFEWREMLQLFYREHEQLRLRKDAWKAQTMKKMQANRARLAKGEKLVPPDYSPLYSVAEVGIRKDIRRARLKEFYCEDEEMVWAIGSLKHHEARNAATGASKALRLDVDLPGAAFGERWFPSTNLVQRLYLDEWSCVHKIDMMVERVRFGS